MSPFGERRFARKHAPKDLNPDQLGWNQSCCHYTRGVCCFSGSRETRTHKSRSRPPVFKTGSSSGRMTSVFQAAGVGIEPTASWFRARRHYQQQLPRSRSSTHRVRFEAAPVRESHPTCELQRPAPRLAIPARECPAGVEPASPGWKPGAFAARPRAHVASGRRGSRTLKACHARPLSRRLPSPVGLPFRYPSCGGRNRTCVWTGNSRLPVPTRAPPHQSIVSQDGWI